MGTVQAFHTGDEESLDRDGSGAQHHLVRRGVWHPKGGSVPGRTETATRRRGGYRSFPDPAIRRPAPITSPDPSTNARLRPAMFTSARGYPICPTSTNGYG